MYCKFCGDLRKSKNSLTQHEIRCNDNPEKILHPKGFKGKTFSKETLEIMSRKSKIRFNDETFKEQNRIQLLNASASNDLNVRKKISESMKKAHQEGRAWNIGQSRWNNEPSWPEKFFMQIIENEFDDKNYQREFRFGKFALDFAWIHKTKCIEIDGGQHLTDPEQIRRDKEKNELLATNNWEILRISWKDMSNNTKFWIDAAKHFINEN